MNKNIPDGYLGLSDVILDYAEMQEPALWAGAGFSEKRIWERLRSSTDAWQHLDRHLEIEFERTSAQDIFDRKDLYDGATEQVRFSLYNGLLSAIIAPLNWYLEPDSFEICEPYVLSRDFWLADVRAKKVIQSGISEHSTGDLLILIPEHHVTIFLRLHQRLEGSGQEEDQNTQLCARTADAEEGVIATLSPPNAEAYRTGCPGMPSPISFVVREFQRRCEAGLVAEKLNEEAKSLNKWCSVHHPNIATPQPTTIENRIRNDFREFKKIR